MTRPTFYVDLDRTIFRTDRVEELFVMIEKLYPDNVLAHKGYALRADYCVYPQKDDGDETAYYHDIVRWLHDAGIDEHEVFERLKRTQLSDGHLEYPDVAKLVDTLRQHGTIKILTYGEDTYQRFKAQLCPSIEGIEVITTIEPKANFLNRHAKIGDWIIDDKPIKDLKPGIYAIQVVQERKEEGTLGSLKRVLSKITDSL